MQNPPIDEWGLVRSDQEEAEESYFVSMTDMMVGLLFIFIIMLMAFGLMLKVEAHNTQITRKEIREVVKESHQDVIDMRHLDRLRAQMLYDIQNRLLKRGVKVIVREENGVLQLPDEILFAKNEDKLSPDGLAAIAHLAAALDAVLGCYARVPPDLAEPDCRAQISDQLRLEAVFVEGHTDSDGTQDYNWALSAHRAINTFRALDERSRLATKLLNDENQYLFSVAGYGENRPEVDGHSEEAKRKNRRIDLRFVMHVSHEEALRRVQKRLEKVLELP